MIRDIRVDTVGFVKRLVKELHDPQVDAIKASLKEKGGTEAAGDVFVAKLAGGANGTTVIDAMKWFGLWKAKIINRHQLFAGMRISVEFAQELLSAADFARISYKAPGVPRLCVDPLGDLPPNIKLAIAELAKITADHKEEAAPQTPPKAAAAARRKTPAKAA